MLLTLTRIRQKLPCIINHPKRAYMRVEEESSIRLPDEVLEHLPVTPDDGQGV